MSRRKDLQESLAEVGLFSACSKRDLGILARHTEVVTVPAGSELTTEGEEGDAFYVVLDGTAVVRRKGRKVASLGPGSHFGELAMLDPAPRDATVTAESAMTVGCARRPLVPGGRPRRPRAQREARQRARPSSPRG